MPSAKGMVGQYARLASAIALMISSVSAQAALVTVNGNTSDIIGVVGTQNITNYAYGDDPLGSTEGTESNNGFDIDKVYAFYDQTNDVLYLGLNVYGTVGNSLPVGSASSNEGIANLGTGSNSKTIFDANETYGIKLYFGTSILDTLLLSFNVTGSNTNGTDNLVISSNGYNLGISQAVSETSNGVEYSITGLVASGAIPYINNQNLLVRFSAGSADTNSTSTASEDVHLLQMQVIPVPAAAWLFGSGIVGLIAAARTRQKM